MKPMVELDKYQGKLKIGTCSWKYDSWKGLVYDPDKKYSPYDYLADYAKHYNTVEIDQWFWSLFGAGAKPERLQMVELTDAADARRRPLPSSSTQPSVMLIVRGTRKSTAIIARRPVSMRFANSTSSSRESVLSRLMSLK